jgi:hypothetical protein
VNFLTDFRSVNGATPANEFQISARRAAGHSVASFASSFSLSNTCAFSRIGRNRGVRRDVVLGIDYKH